MSVINSAAYIAEIVRASALPKQLVVDTYKQIFGMNLCGTCGNVDLQGAVNSIIKWYNNQSEQPMSKKQKYTWNLQYKGIKTFVNGVVVEVGDNSEQELLEVIFNDPNRSGLVIKNEVAEQPENTDVSEVQKPIKKNKK